MNVSEDDGAQNETFVERLLVSTAFQGRNSLSGRSHRRERVTDDSSFLRVKHSQNQVSIMDRSLERDADVSCFVHHLLYPHTTTYYVFAHAPQSRRSTPRLSCVESSIGSDSRTCKDGE